MDFNSISLNERNQLYINTVRPVINRRGLFSDMSGEYVIPPEPNPYSILKIRFRSVRDNIDRVFFVCHSDRILMDFLESDEEFDYYQTQITMEDQPISYYFEVVSGRVTYYYDMRGASRDIQESNSFTIIPGFKTPDWAKGAVMYQIYIDRFFNGDTSNDVQTGEYAYIGDHVTHVEDWYKYPAAMGVREFYGGDLEGVRQKLDYLKELGVEAIYFNPLFVSPSNHKYDIQDYDYIDPHIGKIVEEEGDLLAQGDFENRHATKYINRVTNKKNLEASNELFIQLVKEAHAKGIRVIIDGVFNHCGSYNKWMDRECIYENQPGYEKGAYVSPDSPYHNFFKFNGGSYAYNPNYDGWWGHDTLPKLNYEASPELESYILDIARKWVSPPFNCDGWRLDVAADVGHSPEYNHRFWQKFRTAVKEANPEAIIIAEHYGSPKDWLKGKEWDTVMNYDAFMEPVTWFLTGMQKHSDDYREDLYGNADSFWGAMRYHTQSFSASSISVSMNELSNHDHSRFLTRTNHKVGRMNSLGCEAANIGINKAVMREAVVIQMTWIGAPTIYYGDEAGVCGFTDPDNRRTYPWGREDQELIRFHKEMIRIRKECPEMKVGSTKYIMGDYCVLAYARFDRHYQSIVIINNNNHDVGYRLSVWESGVPREGTLTRLIMTDENSFSVEPVEYPVTGGKLEISLPRFSACVLRNTKEKPLVFSSHL